MNISREVAISVFGLKDNFTQSELKSRYRSLSKITHPDTGGDEDLFKFITICKEVLENSKNFNSSNSSFNKTSSYTNNNSKTSKQDSKETANIKLQTLYEIIYDLGIYIEKYDIQTIHTQIDVTISSRKRMNNQFVNLHKSFKDFEESGFVKFPTTVINLSGYSKLGRKLKVEVILLDKTYKFNITKKHRFYTVTYSHRNLSTFIPLEFKW